jgi:hypothetical protein
MAFFSVAKILANPRPCKKGTNRTIPLKARSHSREEHLLPSSVLICLDNKSILIN